MKKLKRLKKGLVILLTVAMVVGMVPDIGTIQVSAATWTPVDKTTLQPGSTFDVNTITHGSTLGVDRYTMNQAGATYTLTGYNWYDTVARFAVNKSCTIVLDNVTLKAGLTYEDDGVTNYNSGNHGIFEIADGITVNFVLKGESKITAKRYYNDTLLTVNGILLGKESTITFSGGGNLDLDGTIARKFLTSSTGVKDSQLIMESGRVSVDGIGNYKCSYLNNGNFQSTIETGHVKIIYKGGSFYNEQDDKEDSIRVDDWQTGNCSGNDRRVSIPITNTSQRTGLKIGADGTYSYIDCPNRGKIYTWHSHKAGKVIDYYVKNKNEYHHYRHTCADNSNNDWLTEATEVTDEDSISAASGTLKVGDAVTSNATLSFRSQDGSESFQASCTTDANGAYYKAMPRGTYQVSLMLSGSDKVYDMGTISLTAETKHTFDFSLSTLEGTVTDTSNKPLDKAVITVTHNGTTYSAIAGNDGKYSLVLPYGIAQVNGSFEATVVSLKADRVTNTVIYQEGNITHNFELTVTDTDTLDIYTEDDLVMLSALADQLSGRTINLMADITLSGNFTGIQHTATLSNITFNGNGHTIENMTKPLFWNENSDLLISGGSFSNLHLKGNIVGSEKSDRLGALASEIGNITIEGCSFEGLISTTNYRGTIGGLIGMVWKSCSIKNSFVSLVKIDGNNTPANMGGLLGRVVNDCTITNCGVIIKDFQGESDTSWRGALAGYMNQCMLTVKNCYFLVNAKKNGVKVSRIYGGAISSAAGATCTNSFSYAPSGVFTDGVATGVTDLSETLVTAAAGNGTGENAALIDRLNTYASANSLGSWYRRADGYPSPIRRKFKIAYAGGTKGTGSCDAVTILQGDSVTLPGVVFKNADNIQKGWATTENGAKAYDLSASITPTDNMTLYPYWEAKPAASCNAPIGLSAYYGDTVGSISLPEGLTWNASENLVGDVGTHTFVATYTPTGEEAEIYGKNTNVQISVEVKKVPSSYKTLVSEVSDLTYNRTVQNLVTAGETSDGTIVYSLTEDGEYTTTIPTATDAGTYTVYYKIQGDANHEDSRVGLVSVSIKKGSLTGAAITLGESLTYNSEEQTQSIKSVKVGDVTLTPSDYVVTDNKGTEPDTYTLTVTGQGNFEGSATKDFTIAKKAAATVADINKSYVNTVGSKDALVSIDIASLLPTDRGETMYSLADNSAVYVTDKAVAADGKLTYKVGTNGTAGENTTLTVTAKSANYEDITVKVNIHIVDKYVVAEKEGAKAAIIGSNELTYGQKLSTLTLNTDAAVFVEDGNPTKVVAGTLAWTNPDAVLDAGTTTAQWIFTPEDIENYTTLTGNLTIKVLQKVIKVNALDQVIYTGENVHTTLTEDNTIPVISYEGFNGTEEQTAVINTDDMPTVSAEGYNASSPAGNYVITVSTCGSVKADAAKNYKLEKGNTATLTVIEKKTDTELTKVFDDATSGTLDSVAVAEPGAPKADLDSIFVENAKGLLTEAEAAAVKGNDSTAGKDALLYLKLSNVDTTATQPEKDAIESKMKSAVAQDAKVGKYLDVSLFLKIAQTSNRQITDTSDTKLGENKGFKVKVTIDIPSDIPSVKTGYNRMYKIIRAHYNNTGKLETEVLETTQNGNQLTFETDKFSVYAITYKDTEKPSVPVETEKPLVIITPEPTTPAETEKPHNTGGGSSSGNSSSSGGSGSSSGGGGGISSVPVTGITVTPENATLTKAGESIRLTAEVSPSYATNKNVTWTSDNEAVATVDSTGKVTAVGNGTATITATTQSGNKTATVVITVNIVPVVSDKPPVPTDTDQPSVPAETEKPPVIIPTAPVTTENPTGTVTPIVPTASVVTATPEVTAAPTVPTPIVEPTVPAETDTPKDTTTPKETATPEPTATPKKVTSEFGTLKARSKKQTSTTVTLKWSKVSKADGYLIYGSKCNTKDKKYTNQLRKTIKGNKTLSWTQKKLKKATGYKYQIKAYKLVNGRKVVIAQSVGVYAITKGGKYCITEAVEITKLAGKKVSEKSLKLTLKKGKNAQITAAETPAEKKKSIKRYRGLCYESSNSKVATVTKSGKIKAVKKGTCKIYVYAQNGVYKTITITVK